MYIVRKSNIQLNENLRFEWKKINSSILNAAGFSLSSIYFQLGSLQIIRSLKSKSNEILVFQGDEFQNEIKLKHFDNEINQFQWNFWSLLQFTA